MPLASDAATLDRLADARRRTLDRRRRRRVCAIPRQTLPDPGLGAMRCRQCQAARDELAGARAVGGAAGRPTGLGGAAADTRTPSLREVADLESSCSPDIARALETCADASHRASWLIALRDVGDGRQRGRATGDRDHRAPRGAGRRARRHSTTSSSTTGAATCSRSATTSASTASTPASTTCSRPKRGSQLRRDRAGQAAAGALVRARAAC